MVFHTIIMILEKTYYHKDKWVVDLSWFGLVLLTMVQPIFFLPKRVTAKTTLSFGPGVLVEDQLFRQDNVPISTFMLVKTWFQEHRFKIVRYLAPSINIIKNLWSYLAL